MTSGSSDCFNCLLSGASLTGIASVDYSNFGFVLVQLRFRLVALAFVRVSPLTSVYYTGTVVDSGPVLNTLTNQVDCFTTSLFFSFILLSIRQGRPSCEHHAVLVIKISGLLFGSRAVAKSLSIKLSVFKLSTAAFKFVSAEIAQHPHAGKQ